jgi:hypothetical protein
MLGWDTIGTLLNTIPMDDDNNLELMNPNQWHVMSQFSQTVLIDGS